MPCRQVPSALLVALSRHLPPVAAVTAEGVIGRIEATDQPYWIFLCITNVVPHPVNVKAEVGNGFNGPAVSTAHPTPDSRPTSTSVGHSTTPSLRLSDPSRR